MTDGADPEFGHLIEDAFPGQAARHFAPMVIGGTAEGADAGAAAILAGEKTLTSSTVWDFPDGRIPFVGALSVLLNGARRPVAIVETTRVAVMPFGAADAAMALAYGEGERTLDWFRREIGDWYRTAAARHGAAFTEETEVIFEWFRVARRL
jgi:uncharacterized protein YhfF